MSSTTRAFGLVAALLVGAAGLAAQDEQVENPTLFLERSYLAPFTPTGKDLILEGQAATHLWFRNGLANETWRARGGWGSWDALVTMVLVARISRSDFSNPVRTPSFIVRPYVQRMHLSRTGRDGTDLRIVRLGAGLTHHSNGQAGCTFEGQVYDPSPAVDDCVTTDPARYAQRIANTRDGSFSTNFFRFDVSARWAELTRGGTLSRHLTAHLRSEFHPADFLKGGLSEELGAEYGQALIGIELEGEVEARGGYLRGAIGHASRFGGVKDDVDTAAHLELAWTSKSAGRPGVFVRWNLGADYYNIRFQDRSPSVSIGLIWDGSRLDEFGLAPRGGG